MLRQCDRQTVERLSADFMRTIHAFQKTHSGMNLELLNALAIGAAIVIASADDGQAEQVRDWFLLALDNQIADFRREFGR